MTVSLRKCTYSCETLISIVPDEEELQSTCLNIESAASAVT